MYTILALQKEVTKKKFIKINSILEENKYSEKLGNN